MQPESIDVTIHMSLSSTYSEDLVVNSIAVVKGNRLIDLVEAIGAVQGLAPETLNSLEKLANTLHGDSSYFQTVSTAIGNKADKSTTYTKTPRRKGRRRRHDDQLRHHGDDLHKSRRRQ